MLLWYSGQMLSIIQTAVSTHTVDKALLLRIAVRHLAWKAARRIMYLGLSRSRPFLEQQIRQHFDQRLFGARARLDLPTSEDPAVQHQLSNAMPSNGHRIAVSAWNNSLYLLRASTNVTSQISVHVNLLREQPNGMLLAALIFVAAWIEQVGTLHHGPVNARVWAATTKNEDYLRMQGYKQLNEDLQHRKELVAGNLAEALTSCTSYNEGYFYELSPLFDPKCSKWELVATLAEALGDLPRIVFTFLAADQPASVPVTVASLHLIEQTVGEVTYELQQIYVDTKGFARELADIRALHDVAQIPNKVRDGSQPFPEDTQKIGSGVVLEFRNVSFKYPSSESYALRNVSFKLLAGQLCIGPIVIVGSNGSGKSTILKLIVRLYDPEEGAILLDGRDIRTLKLHDLRQAISVLFQDYTLFPLSIRDNIGLGDPQHAGDDERIARAAELGGASEVFARLPEGMDTYLNRPVKDLYGDLPAGTHTLFGRRVDYSSLRAAGDMSSVVNMGLSGGQMQRIAVARTFMRSVVSEEANVGLLLFDEPSASLDPAAEHDLFSRLRDLRGNKTMLFSSHHFGNLTRHADHILYMSKSVVVESGTHDRLLAVDGEYARLWKLQAEAFL
ncbi:hypothetical protein CERSUDRAFT_146118 [Gelatoporia subvermispora B]|uniref:ABC transporter domain-containing protein n=1 Tax=Ceriporiopsis subvermispora (strain B) TaxID=914234 RepID=M2RA16_CERS8|nr:hypothetical protein CERSUDRAFT_146118 [Gelatoporia subvermispora B]